VHRELLRRAATISKSKHIPLAMHIAESREELKLLATAGGPLRIMAEEFGAWTPAAIRLGSRPLDYLQQLANADRALVIHGNYLTAEEIEFVAERRERMSIIYCPRTHERFGHSPYPLVKMLKAGTLVALGTDSRASNPDLSLFAEMRHVATHHLESPTTVLEMGTINGAKALGIANEVGSLDVGKFADLAIVNLPDSRSNDPLEALLDAESKVVSTYFRGQPSDGTQY
jgi:cytosine/adenosine deaminase-related metal-dependent hydrolase